MIGYLILAPARTPHFATWLDQSWRKLLVYGYLNFKSKNRKACKSQGMIRISPCMHTCCRILLRKSRCSARLQTSQIPSKIHLMGGSSDPCTRDMWNTLTFSLPMASLIRQTNISIFFRFSIWRLTLRGIELSRPQRSQQCSLMPVNSSLQ